MCLLSAGLALSALACGDDEPSSPTGGTGGNPPAPTVVIDVIVDASRDGVADPADPADEAGEESWDAEHGAMFLPNLDDDDEDGVRDADDVRANGGADDLDLARFVVAACPECPEDAKGTLSIPPEAAKNVRVFLLDAAGAATLVAGQMGACSDADGTCTTQTTFELSGDALRAGATFALEGRDVVRSDEGWDGTVLLSYKLTDAEGAPLGSEENPDGLDRALLRVAPWQLFGNLSAFDTVRSDTVSTAFVNGVDAGAEAADVFYRTYSNYDDQWTQDFYQTGFFAVVVAGESGPVIHGMRVANARPWGRSTSDARLPIRWLNKNYLGPDRATLVVYDSPHTGDSFDSHGNHDLLPPYTNGDESFPLGRIIIGSGVLPETKAFYEAQQLQAPIYVADTSWLFVGHVDEYLSYVPAATPRGWKLLVASPRRAREMLLAAQASGHGAAVVREGREWLNWNNGSEYPADITIDELLADVDVLEASDDAQAVIDQEVEQLAAAVGLDDDDIVEVPFLFHAETFGGVSYKVAYQPGTVNALVMGDVFVAPKPFGPKIDGVDLFEVDLEQRLGTAESALGSDGQGLDVRFADDWDWYHRLDGEVHCGTNPEGPVSEQRWWETGR